MDIAAVFIAALLGSPHCAAMCGGFVALYSANARSSIAAHTGYHLGRLTTYVSLGILAGSIGQGFNKLGVLLGVQRAAMLVTGLLLVASGFRVIVGGKSGVGSKIHQRIVTWARPLLSDAVVARGGGGRFDGAFIVGLVSTLLPCGFLYTFVLVAGARADFVSAVVTMVVFWLGTAPSLLALGAVLPRIVALIGDKRRWIQGILLIAAGLFSLWMHTAHGLHGAHHDHAPHHQH